MVSIVRKDQEISRFRGYVPVVQIHKLGHKPPFQGKRENPLVEKSVEILRRNLQAKKYLIVKA